VSTLTLSCGISWLGAEHAQETRRAKLTAHTRAAKGVLLEGYQVLVLAESHNYHATEQRATRNANCKRRMYVRCHEPKGHYA